MSLIAPLFSHPAKALILLGLVAGMTSALPADEWEQLVANSPFGGNAGAAAKPEAPAALEFRGFVQEGDVQFFNIYDLSSKTARWLAMDGEKGSLTVANYDESTHEIVLLQDGKQIRLPLKVANVTLVAAPVAAPPTGPPENTPPGRLEVATDEKARLQKIAEEIRRRRALRAQAAENAAKAPAEQ